MKTFSLSETQEIKLEEWKEAIKKVFGEYGNYDYIFPEIYKLAYNHPQIKSWNDKFMSPNWG